MQLAALSASHDCNASASIPAAPMHALYERLNVQGCAFRHIFLKGAKGLANLCMNSIRTKRWLPGHVMGLFLVQDGHTPSHRQPDFISVCKGMAYEVDHPFKGLEPPFRIGDNPKNQANSLPISQASGCLLCSSASTEVLRLEQGHHTGGHALHGHSRATVG